MGIMQMCIYLANPISIIHYLIISKNFDAMDYIFFYYSSHTTYESWCSAVACCIRQQQAISYNYCITEIPRSPLLYASAKVCLFYDISEYEWSAKFKVIKFNEL